jgi:hypothetical protein
MTLDSAGAMRASAYLLNSVEQWRATTIPDGDRTTTIPPNGGTATTTITNGLGQAVQLLQYLARPLWRRSWDAAVGLAG